MRNPTGGDVWWTPNLLRDKDNMIACEEVCLIPSGRNKDAMSNDILMKKLDLMSIPAQVQNRQA